ncbi:MAG: elongation factor G [Candidatus Nealsonbacteria bacterium CG02_land_8_20_14_3_00_40_11]|uniref:Elongation factor G n=1 Tax=Candidatus Nealsonbacteria bacterium CG02_land_8_20_14_3_00_40_11 TaxID=1974700 RepID=A0A2M7D7H6_9BACT|nr:MAG: elongation factor G [Candidatus Nealsonbacteria bacterium CG02_land_8_20_14_3_00_40_11]
MPRSYPIEKVRDIGIIAHISAGKTTTSTCILYHTGKVHKIGTLEKGTTPLDWMVQSQERAMTIMAAATTCYWKANGEDFQINIIDTPGHIDFTAEVQRSLRVLDGAVVVFDGGAGVQSQSETVWRQADQFKVPRICFVNKMDKMGASLEVNLDSITKRLTLDAIPVQLPIGEEENFSGVVDLLKMKAIRFEGKEGEIMKEGEIPEELKEKANIWRKRLVEKIAAEDHDLLEKYLGGEELSLEELRKGLRKATISNKLFPVFFGSLFKRIGVQPLIDAIVYYLPSPADLLPVKGTDPKTGEIIERKPLDEEPLSALAFKIMTDPFVGTLTFFRIYSGHLVRGSYVLNSVTGEKERIGRILRMHADERQDLEEGFAGDILSTVGLKDTSTGNTLCDENSPIVLEKIIFPEPVIGIKVEPKTKADQEKMGIALKKLAEEDPTFKTKSDLETGETVISGMGELHLEIIVDRMKREFNVGVNVGRPQVAYKETIKEMAEAEGKYIHQSGGRGQYGHVWLKVEPQERGKGFEFVNEIKGGTIPQEFIPAVGKGVKEAMDKGVVVGYPLVDILATLYDGSFHEVDSSENAFKIAGSMAFQSACKKAKPVILEPIMKLEVITPEEFFGDVIGDLSARRGKIEESKDRLQMKVIDAKVSLAEMFGYATSLRSLTEGRGTFTMEFNHYEEVPQNIAQEIIDGKRR